MGQEYEQSIVQLYRVFKMPKITKVYDYYTVLLKYSTLQLKLIFCQNNNRHWPTAYELHCN